MEKQTKFAIFTVLHCIFVEVSYLVKKVLTILVILDFNCMDLPANLLCSPFDKSFGTSL